METIRSLTEPYVEAAPMLVDEPAGVVVRGCEPHAPVTITAVVDGAGGVFRAQATFEADESGAVDTAVAASTAGTYRGVDPFGLWWSGEPVGPSAASPVALTARLRVETATGRAEATAERRWLAPGATTTPVNEGGVCGLFARPAGDGPFPGVIAFSGSGGGLGPAASWAPVLAAHGFATLAIAYFGAPGLPANLERIEVEVVERAIAWLSRRDDVAPAVAVMGQSRGSELALLAGSLLDGVAAVAAFAPSGVSWSALGPRGPIPASAWTFRGDDLPYAPTSPPPGVDLSSASGPVALRPIFDSALAADPDAVRAAEIPVEQTRGPILLISGESDAMWPSADMADIVVRRAAERDFGHSIVHLRYPDAGHNGFGVPGTPVVVESGPHPLTGVNYTFGGTRAANAAARADCWPRLLDFLAAALQARRVTGSARA